MNRRLLCLLFALLMLGSLTLPIEGIVLHCRKTGQDVTPHWEEKTQELACCPNEKVAPYQFESSCCDEQWRSGQLSAVPPAGGKHTFDFIAVLTPLPKFVLDTSVAVCPHWYVGKASSPRGPPRFMPPGRAPPVFS